MAQYAIFPDIVYGCGYADPDMDIYKIAVAFFTC